MQALTEKEQFLQLEYEDKREGGGSTGKKGGRGPDCVVML